MTKSEKRLSQVKPLHKIVSLKEIFQGIPPPNKLMKKLLSLIEEIEKTRKPKNMAKPIPPAFFYRLSKQEQEDEAVKRMNAHYESGDQWKRLAQQARKKHIPDPDIDLIDTVLEKD